MSESDMSLRVAALRARLEMMGVWISADDRIHEADYATHVRGVKVRQMNNLRLAKQTPEFSKQGKRVTYRLDHIIEFHSPKSNL